MLNSIILYFYPDLKPEEIKKFGLLSIIFLLIIGTYWLLRLLKNTIFLKIAFPLCFGWSVTQGCLFQPIAKGLSPLIVLIMVLIYSKLVDLVKKHQLFYIFCTLYATLFAGCAGMLFIRDVYGPEVLGKTPLALMGWLSFFAVESFGSLVVALFWSFANSITKSEAAQRGFPFIIAVAQLAAIFGSGTLFFSDSIGSLWPILLFSALLIAAIIPLVHYFMKVIPPEQQIGNSTAAQEAEEDAHKKKENFLTGFISGLILLFSRPYLFGVLVLSTFYESISQIIEYQMNVFAHMSPDYVSDLAFARFQSIYGMSINTISFLIALLGTSYIIRRLGTRISLLIFPAVFGVTLLGLFLFFQSGQSPTALLWATFGAMVLIKGIGYAVNNPTKEIMYIPTSKDAKFKTKGWIDTFGSRFAKAGGARINNAFKYSMSELMLYGSMFGFGLVGVWFVAAFLVGLKNKQLVEKGEIIE